ncbi:MAG: dipeptide epimerase [Cyclobacteriaceae bacterium]|nr:dipeptide epimerase [Cyclobacteriaceae bacterium]
MKLKLRPFDLHLKHTFKIAHDERDVQKTLIVQLSDGQFTGLGEGTASNYYNNSLESMVEVIEAAKTKIEAYDGSKPEEFWEKTNDILSANTFAQSAIDLAIHDLYGKLQGKPLHKIWGQNIQRLPQSNYTIGIDSIETMVNKMKEVPWPIYKIKLGTSEDIAIIKELRKHTNAVFRIDANCGWGVEETIENSKLFKKLGVEFIEQPLKADNWKGMKEVYAHSALPIIADESCIKEDSVAKCKGYFHGINIKLMKCGGLTPARRMIEQTKQLSLKVMVGCMTESSVGISAIAQLSPQLDYIDMDGNMLLTNNIAQGARLVNGNIKLPSANGIGAELTQFLV